MVLLLYRLKKTQAFNIDNNLPLRFYLICVGGVGNGYNAPFVVKDILLGEIKMLNIHTRELNC